MLPASCLFLPYWSFVSFWSILDSWLLNPLLEVVHRNFGSRRESSCELAIKKAPISSADWSKTGRGDDHARRINVVVGLLTALPAPGLILGGQCTGEDFTWSPQTLPCDRVEQRLEKKIDLLFPRDAWGLSNSMRRCKSADDACIRPHNYTKQTIK
jgi:hypothetical protein